MTSYDDFNSRQARLFNPFAYPMRFTTAQGAERMIIWGLYSGAYKNGLEYLQTIDAFELALIIDEYNQKMAALDAEEQNAILDIVTKRYIANIDRVIFNMELETTRDGVDADAALWDAKMEALAADRAALLTLEASLAGRIREIEARIKTLQAQISGEGANLLLVEIDIANKQLDVSKSETELVRKDVELLSKDNEITERYLDLTKKDIELARKQLEIDQKTLDIQKLKLSETEEELRVVEAGIQASKIQLQIVEYGLKELETGKEAAALSIQTDGYTRDIAKTTLIEIEKAEVDIEEINADVELRAIDVRLEEMATDLEKIELQKKGITFDYVKMDKEVAGIRIDIEETKQRIGQTALMEADRDVTQAEYDGDVSKLVLYDAKIGIIETREELVVNDISAEATLLLNDDTIHSSTISNMNADQYLKISKIDISLDRELSQYSDQLKRAQAEYDIVSDEEPYLAQMVDSDINIRLQEEYANGMEQDARLTNLETIMAANILTTLRHSIGIER